MFVRQIYSIGYLLSRLHTPLPEPPVPVFVGLRGRPPCEFRPRPVCMPVCTEIEVARTPNVVNVYTPTCSLPAPVPCLPAPKPCYYNPGTYLEQQVGVYDRQELYQSTVALPGRQPWYNYARRWLPNVAGYGRNNYF